MNTELIKELWIKFQYPDLKLEQWAAFQKDNFSLTLIHIEIIFIIFSHWELHHKILAYVLLTILLLTFVLFFHFVALFIMEFIIRNC